MRVGQLALSPFPNVHAPPGGDCNCYERGQNFQHREAIAKQRDCQQGCFAQLQIANRLQRIHWAVSGMPVIVPLDRPGSRGAALDSLASKLKAMANASSTIDSGVNSRK